MQIRVSFKFYHQKDHIIQGRSTLTVSVITT